jgi:hypothetical protein
LAIFSAAASSLSVALPPKPLRFSLIFGARAGGFSVDGTYCTKTNPTLNSQTRVSAVACQDNASGILYFNVDMPDSWDPSVALAMRLSSLNNNVTEGDVLALDISCMCRGDSDSIDDSWGSGAAADTTFTTSNDLEYSDSVASVTPGGSCAAGDSLFCRGVIDAGTTNITSVETKVSILSVRVEWTKTTETDA